MTSTEIKTRLDGLNEQARPLLAQIAQTEREHRAALSREWIAANGVMRGNVQRSGGDGMPYFGHIQQFVLWLRGQVSPQPWAEWNETIYRTADLLADKMARDAPGRYDDLPQ